MGLRQPDILLHPHLDERSDVLYAPGGDPRAQLDWCGVPACLYPRPPRRLADRNTRRDRGAGLQIPNNIWKPKEASFGKFSHFGSLSSGLVRGNTGGAKLERIER